MVSKLAAMTEKIAVSPILTVLLTGCCEITGAVLESRTTDTLLDIALIHPLLFLVCTV